MADTPISLSLERIKEQIAALNFASDALTALQDQGEISDTMANLRLRRLSARRTDLRDARMTIILTQAVINPPTAEQVADLRSRVNAMYHWNAAAASIDDLIGAALEIATS